MPSALRDSRLRSGYDTNLVESISIPILGVDEVPAKPYEVRAVSPQRLYGVLYVYSSEQGSRLLPPAHLLWLRELAGVLSVYLSSGKALARRDRHLMQDHERGYHDFLIVSDSEETTEYGLFLAYLAELISTRRRANSPAPTIDEELPVPESAPRPGITFMYIDMAGRVRDERRSLYPATLPEQTELRYRHFQKLFREVGRRMQQFQDEGHIESFAATPYQRGVLVAIKVGEGVLHDKLLRLLRSRCYRFLVRFDTNFRERRGHLPLSAVIFHHSWQGEVGSYLRGSLGDERPEVRKLRTALRVIDPLLAAFRERVAERERADSGSGQEILPGEYHPPVYYNSWVNPAEWDEEPRRDPGERPTAL